MMRRLGLRVPIELAIPFLLCLAAIAFMGPHHFSDCWRQPIGSSGWEVAACPSNAR
jgi:hypothetical protein